MRLHKEMIPNHSEIRVVTKLGFKSFVPYETQKKVKEIAAQWEHYHESGFGTRFIITINEPENNVVFQILLKNKHTESRVVSIAAMHTLRYEDIFSSFSEDVKNKSPLPQVGAKTTVA